MEKQENRSYEGDLDSVSDYTVNITSREFNNIATYIHSSRLQLLFAEIAGHLKLYNMYISMYIFLHRNEFSLARHSCVVGCFMAAVMRLMDRPSAR